jgi:hypothetical protein
MAVPAHLARGYQRLRTLLDVSRAQSAPARHHRLADCWWQLIPVSRQEGASEVLKLRPARSQSIQDPAHRTYCTSHRAIHGLEVRTRMAR